MAEAGLIRVVLVWCLPRLPTQRRELLLPVGTRAAEVPVDGPGSPVGWARWGVLLKPEAELVDGDELTAVLPLRADPKLARRQRVAQQRKVRRASGKKTCWLPA